MPTSIFTTEKIWKVATILLATLFLASFAFFNRFPLLYPDTGTYIESGFKLYVPNDRPVHYGIFIRLCSLSENIWLVVLAQCGLLALTLRFFCARVMQFSNRQFLILVIVLVTCTGVTLPAGQLIPDVFTPILLLSAFSLIMARNLSRYEIVALLSIGILAGVMHMSHILLLWLLCLGLILLLWKDTLRRPQIKFILILTLGSTILIPSTHVLISDRFQFIPKAYLFHLNRLVEAGVLDEFLKDVCDESDYRLCEYQGRIPTDFLWDQEKSPLYLLGGWNENKEEYREIVRRVHLNPKYWIKIGSALSIWSVSQFFSYEVFDMRYLDDDRVPLIVARHFPHQAREVELGYQVSSPPRTDAYGRSLDSRQKILVPVCFVFILLFWPKMTSELRWITVLILASLVLNALVSGGLSTVVPRYQNRIIWLISLPVMGFLFQNYFTSRTPD